VCCGRNEPGCSGAAGSSSAASGPKWCAAGDHHIGAGIHRDCAPPSAWSPLPPESPCPDEGLRPPIASISGVMARDFRDEFGRPPSRRGIGGVETVDVGRAGSGNRLFDHAGDARGQAIVVAEAESRRVATVVVLVDDGKRRPERQQRCARSSGRLRDSGGALRCRRRSAAPARPVRLVRREAFVPRLRGGAIWPTAAAACASSNFGRGREFSGGPAAKGYGAGGDQDDLLAAAGGRRARQSLAKAASQACLSVPVAASTRVEEPTLTTDAAGQKLGDRFTAFQLPGPASSALASMLARALHSKWAVQRRPDPAVEAAVA